LGYNLHGGPKTAQKNDSQLGLHSKHGAMRLRLLRSAFLGIFDIFLLRFHAGDKDYYRSALQFISFDRLRIETFTTDISALEVLGDNRAQ